jgi:hypothetical protein
LGEFDVITLISNVGFPIAIAVYLLVRFETQIKNLTEAVNGLKMVIAEKMPGEY